jgi:hypothetical protein
MWALALKLPPSSEEFLMSANSKKSISRTLILILLGIIALVAGVKSLIVLIPAAMLVYFGTDPVLRSGRN